MAVISVLITGLYMVPPVKVTGPLSATALGLEKRDKSWSLPKMKLFLNF